MPIQLTKCVLFHKTYSYWPSIRLVSVSFIKRFQRPSTNNGSIASIGIIMFSSCNRVELILIDDVFIVKLDHTLQTTYRIPWLRLSQTVFTWHLSASTALLLQAKFDSAASILSLSLSLSQSMTSYHPRLAADDAFVLHDAHSRTAATPSVSLLDAISSCVLFLSCGQRNLIDVVTRTCARTWTNAHARCYERSTLFRVDKVERSDRDEFVQSTYEDVRCRNTKFSVVAPRWSKFLEQTHLVTSDIVRQVL